MYSTVIKPMLAESIDPSTDLKRYEGTHVAQIKYDGTRVIVIKDGLDCKMMTRSWKNDLAPRYPELVDQAMTCSRTRYIIDAELIFIDRNTRRGRFLNALATKEERAGLIPYLMVFDVQNIGGDDMRHLTYQWRMPLIDQFRRENMLPVQTFTKDFGLLFSNVVADGGEGIILKSLSGTYRCDGVNGNRSKDWLKVKRSETADCFVVGLQTGKGKTASTFGALIVGQFVDGHPQIVGRVSGMTDADRRSLCDEISAMPEYDGFTSMAGKRDIQRLVIPEMVVEVECMERTEDNMMRHPRFIRVRRDKAPTECVL